MGQTVPVRFSGQAWTTSSRRTDGASRNLRVRAFTMWSCCAWSSGTPRYNSRSKRPATAHATRVVSGCAHESRTVRVQWRASNGFTWPKQGRLEQVRSVGGANHEHVRRLVDAVQLGEQLRHDPVHHACTSPTNRARNSFSYVAPTSKSGGGGRRTSRICARAASRSERVELVEEDNTRPRVPGALEGVPHVLLTLTDVPAAAATCGGENYHNKKQGGLRQRTC